MTPRRYATMGPPKGVCTKPSKVAAPLIQPAGPPVLRADVRQVLEEGRAELERRLVALLGRQNVIVQPMPLVKTDLEFGAQTWTADHRIHLLVKED